MTDYTKVEITDGIARIKLNRPDSFNALDMPTARELSGVLLELASNSAIQGILITGAGKAFCAGGDIKRAVESPRGVASFFHELATEVHICITEIRRMRKPVVAAINGVAAGGGFSLALACDFRVMTESAKLKQGFTSNALCIDGGGTFMLPRLVGFARALEIATFDDPIDAGRALEWGLVNEVVPDQMLIDRSLNLIDRVRSKSLHTFGWSKDLLNGSFETPLETQLTREREGLVACVAHPDGQEGMAAFLAKRKPKFNPPDS